MSQHSETAWPSPVRGWIVTIILLIAFTFSFVDRQVLNLLVEPIRADLRVSDTQISFLQGIGFALTYILMSVPLGRMVDRFNRVAIMIGGVLVWSATTLACGLSGNYTQLLLARLGVGAGEAALTPAAWSVLADYFRPERLSLPVSVYLMGPYLGAGLAMIAGAEILDWSRLAGEVSLPLIGVVAPWQATFIAVGLPGVLIAGLLATIREPERKGRQGTAREVPPWRDIWAFMMTHKRVYAALHLGVPFVVVMLYGLQGWSPTILARIYHWDLADAGRAYGVVALVAGSAGVLSGPVLSRFLRGRGMADAPLRVALLGAFMATAALLTLPFQSTGEAALASIAWASFSVTLPLALVATVIQEITPNDMRGVVNGVYVVTTNVLGLVLGPTLVAVSTDYLFRDPLAVARSLALVALVVGPAAMLLLQLGRKAYAALER